MKPLQNLTIIALEQAVAAPFATRQLADLGARVIKIERPGAGDFARGYDRTVNGLSSHFVWLNRTKESLTLDVKASAGKRILDQLLAQADVFIQNLAPGAVERLGFGNEVLRAHHPRLIICNISGYGAEGPYRDKKAYDALIQAETGVLSITGTAETPSKTGIPVADIAAGMYAFSGILTALIARGQTGEGAVLDVSLFDALAEWMGYPAYYTRGGTAPPRTGSSHAAIAPYGLFATGDGGAVMLSIQNAREWARFCAIVLEQPMLATDSRFIDGSQRVAHRDELHAVIDTVFGALSLTAVVERLDRAHIANARARTMQEFLDHPQLAVRQRWREIGSPAGPLPALLPPVIMAGVSPVMGAIPAVGEHREAILGELGYSVDEIAGMIAEKVV